MLRLTAAAFVSLLKTKLVNTLARGGSWGGGGLFLKAPVCMRRHLSAAGRWERESHFS